MRFVITICLLIGLAGSLQAQPAPAPIKIAILLYPGVELLDFAGPLEVFHHMEGAQVFTVAAQSGPMTIMQKMLTVVPDYTLSTVPQPDILVVPGGRVEDVIQDSSVIRWIQTTTAGRKITMSVCTGAYLLGKAGLLDGKTVTTHWTATEMLQRMMPKATVMEHTRFVDEGSLVTTAGVSAGIDGALHIVSRLQGSEAARTIARIMEYDKWEPEAGLVVGRPVSKSAPKKKAVAVKPTVVKKTSPNRLTTAMLSSPIDPVCQMSVEMAIADTAHYAGKRYGFCSKICKDRFHRQPTAYVKNANH